MGYYKVADFLLNPLFEIIRPIPPIAWIPIVILTMGIGMSAKVFIIFVAAFVPNVINSYLGIRLTDATLINVAKTFGASDWKIFTTVCIPSSMNMVFTGIRLSLSLIHIYSPDWQSKALPQFWKIPEYPSHSQSASAL